MPHLPRKRIARDVERSRWFLSMASDLPHVILPIARSSQEIESILPLGEVSLDNTEVTPAGTILSLVEPDGTIVIQGIEGEPPLDEGSVLSAVAQASCVKVNSLSSFPSRERCAKTTRTLFSGKMPALLRLWMKVDWFSCFDTAGVWFPRTRVRRSPWGESTRFSDPARFPTTPFVWKGRLQSTNS